MSAIAHPYTVSPACAKAKINGLRGGSLTRFTIERKIARLQFERFIGCLPGGGVLALDVNLHFACAADCAGQQLVAALARVYVVVTVSRLSVDCDPYIFQKGAILIFELRGDGVKLGS